MMGFFGKGKAKGQASIPASTSPSPAEDKTFDVEKKDATTPRVDAAMERRIVRKMDVRVIPLVFVLFLLSFLDRSNVGNAQTAGMGRDLHLLGANRGRYDWLATIFYISYITFQFTILAWKVFPPHIWGFCVVLTWGIFSSCQAATQNWSGMMALRFLLGISEAGFGAGIPYLLSFFYLRHELGFRVGFYTSASALASTFSGALAYGIQSGHTSLAAWRVIFLVEGLPTIAMAPVVWFFLPDSPAVARFFTAEEKEAAVARGVRQAGKSKRAGGVDFGDLGRTLLDPKAWFTALMYFSCNVSYSSLPLYLPTLLGEIGFENLEAQGLSAPPYFAGFLVTIITSWTADRTQQRGAHVMGLAIIGGIGYVILASTISTGARYFAVFLVASGVFPAIASIITWTMNNQGNDDRRGMGVVLLNLVGQCGPLLGTRLYPNSDSPRYVKGHAVSAAFVFFVAFLALGLRTLLAWENKKLDRQYGTLQEVKAAREQRVEESVEEANPESDRQDAGAAVENYGPMYRYVL